MLVMFAIELHWFNSFRMRFHISPSDLASRTFEGFFPPTSNKDSHFLVKTWENEKPQWETRNPSSHPHKWGLHFFFFPIRNVQYATASHILLHLLIHVNQCILRTMKESEEWPHVVVISGSSIPSKGVRQGILAFKSVRGKNSGRKGILPMQNFSLYCGQEFIWLQMQWLISIVTISEMKTWDEGMVCES